MKMDHRGEIFIKEGGGWNITPCHGVQGPMAVWGSSLPSIPSDSECPGTGPDWTLRSRLRPQKHSTQEVWFPFSFRLSVLIPLFSSVSPPQVCLHAVDWLRFGAVWPKCSHAGGKRQSLWIRDVTTGGGLACAIQNSDSTVDKRHSSFVHISFGIIVNSVNKLFVPYSI